jgi:hypothetical protein
LAHLSISYCRNYFGDGDERSTAIGIFSNLKTDNFYLWNIEFVNEIEKLSRETVLCRGGGQLAPNFHKIRAISTKIKPSRPIAFKAIESIFQFNGGEIFQKKRVDKSRRRTGTRVRKNTGKGTPGEPEA